VWPKGVGHLQRNKQFTRIQENMSSSDQQEIMSSSALGARRAFIVGVPLGLALGLTACGGGGSASSGGPDTAPPPPSPPAPPSLSSFVGDLGGWGNVDGTGAAARFRFLTHIAGNRMGNAYVFDGGPRVVRRISAAGVVETLAGSNDGRGSVDGIGTAASFGSVLGMAADGDGNVFVVTDLEASIRRITPAGEVSTYAGSPGRPGQLDGFRLEALFTQPRGLAFDGNGNLYVFDFPNIRRISQAGQVSTVFRASSDPAGRYSREDITVFSGGGGAVIDSTGNLYVAATSEHVVLKMTPAGVISTLAGQLGTSGSADGLGINARFHFPKGITIDRVGNLYVGDLNNSTIRKITPSGLVSTLAGTPGVRGIDDGIGALAQFSWPQGVAIGPDDKIYVVEEGSPTSVRVVSPTGGVSTLAGSRLRTGQVDGIGAAARFRRPTRLAADGSGTLYVLDQENLNIRKVSPTGAVSTLAALPDTTRSTDYGPIPRGGIATDASGNLYLGDRPNYTVVKVSPSGMVSTFAGLANASGTADGAGASARFSDPGELAIDAAGNVYLADGPLIRKITPDGQVSTLVAGATFDAIVGIAVTPDGRSLYLTELRSNAVRRVELQSGAVSIFAGASSSAGALDGIGLAARFNQPGSLYVAASGHVYVADNGNFLIRRITPAGSVNTLAGAAGKEGFVPGGLPGVISASQGLAVAGGSLYSTMDAGIVVIRNLT
jgi:sugar lactone lactonase YvrE